MDRIDDLLVDPIRLTKISRSYKNSTFIGTELFPLVTVEAETGWIPQFNKAEFKEYDSARALRASIPTIPHEGITRITYNLTEHSLAIGLDIREIKASKTGKIDLVARTLNVITENIGLSMERKIAIQAQDENNYPAGNKETLSGTDQWDDHTNSDPIGNVEDAKYSIRTKIGQEPNIMVIGPKTYKALKNHPHFLERIKYVQKGVVNSQDIATILDIPRVVVGKAIYSSDDSVFYDIWEDNAILAYVPQSKTVFEPSFAFTLRKEGEPSSKSYPSNDGKVLYYSSTDIFQALMVGSESGFLIKDTVS